MTVYIDGLGSGGSQSVAGVAYERTTNTLVASGSTLVITSGMAAGWRQLSFASHPLLAAGTYAIGVHAGGAGGPRGFPSGAAGPTPGDTVPARPTATVTPPRTNTRLWPLAGRAPPRG